MKETLKNESIKKICIVGPTASGKTALSLELAKRTNSQIISADSMQIYKKLDIGTSKVTKLQRRGIKHYLIDILDVKENFSVADFKNKYDEVSNRLIKNKRNYIVCGGTGQYIKAIYDDMYFEEIGKNENIRKKYEDILNKNSKKYLHDMLYKIDPESAKSIHPNNTKRVIRALEIYEITGKTKTQVVAEENTKRDYSKTKDMILIGIDIPREILYERINNRVDEMLLDGIIKEAKMLYDLKLPKNNTCMQAIGYKEFFKYFEGISTLDECVEKLKQNTRNYAKRQLTWFKQMNNIIWIDGLKDPYDNANNIIKEYYEK